MFLHNVWLLRSPTLSKFPITFHGAFWITHSWKSSQKLCVFSWCPEDVGWFYFDSLVINFKEETREHRNLPYIWNYTKTSCLYTTHRPPSPLLLELESTQFHFGLPALHTPQSVTVNIKMPSYCVRQILNQFLIWKSIYCHTGKPSPGNWVWINNSICSWTYRWVTFRSKY